MDSTRTVVRTDVRIENEATGWLLTSANLNGKPPKTFEKEGAARWNAAIADGSIMPMALVQDDGFDVRVLVNDALTPDEEVEWVDRLTWKLAIPDGRLVIAGGAGYACGDRDERFEATIDVDPGEYRVDVYTYLYSINGSACLGKAGVRQGGLKRYYAQTRPGELIPLRVCRLLDIETAHDQARERIRKRVEEAAQASWRYIPGPEDQIPEREEPEEAIQFLVRLTPLADAPVDAIPRIKRGWFTEVQCPRKPDLFPLGLTSTVGPDTRPACAEPTPLLIPARVFDMPESPIAGGPVEIALPEGLALLCWVALFCDREVSPQIRVRNAVGFAAAALACRDDLHVHADDPDGFTVHCFQWGTNAVRRVHLLASMLQALPDGAMLELATGRGRGSGAAPPSLDEEGDGAAPPGPGMHRYRGRVSGGTWTVEASWPAVDAATLRTALSVAEDIDRCQPVSLPDARVAGAVIEAMSEHAFDYRSRKRRGEPVPEACGASIRLPADSWFQSFEVGAFTLRQLLPAAWPYKLLEDKPLWSFA